MHCGMNEVIANFQLPISDLKPAHRKKLAIGNWKSAIEN
jgi:hypothetical protein